MTTFTTDDRLHAEKDGSLTINCMPKPLETYQIKLIMAQDECWVGEDCSIPDLIRFARAIEKAHGIRWKAQDNAGVQAP